MPILEYNILPRQVYIYKDVVDCVGSGEPTGEIPTGEITPNLVYFALNDTSDRVIAVEVTQVRVRMSVCACACMFVCMFISNMKNILNVTLDCIYCSSNHELCSYIHSVMILFVVVSGKIFTEAIHQLVYLVLEVYIYIYIYKIYIYIYI